MILHECITFYSAFYQNRPPYITASGAPVVADKTKSLMTVFHGTQPRAGDCGFCWNGVDIFLPPTSALRRRLGNRQSFTSQAYNSCLVRRGRTDPVQTPVSALTGSAATPISIARRLSSNRSRDDIFLVAAAPVSYTHLTLPTNIAV